MSSGLCSLAVKGEPCFSHWRLQAGILLLMLREHARTLLRQQHDYLPLQAAYTYRPPLTNVTVSDSLCFDRIDYIRHPHDQDQEDYLNDFWSLHITNTGFIWRQLGGSISRKSDAPAQRWKFAMSTYNSSTALALYGGDDESMGLPQYLDDLWLYSESFSCS